MERTSARCLLFFVTSVFLMTVTVAPVSARVNPAKPPLSAGPSGAPAAAPTFDCGTYKGNESATPWLRDMHTAQQRRIAKERALRGETSSPVPPSHFVYDGVWVVTDDGTLTFSGLNAFDTDFETIRFTPNGAAYDVSSEAAAWDPAFGTNLFLGDDQSVPLAINFTFTYYGVGHTQVYVSSNGAVGLSADPNPSGFFDNDDFFNTAPKIAAYFMDLNPAASGSVHYRADPDKSIVTWNNVVEFGTGITNSLQLVLYDTGVIDVRFNGITSTSAINGLPIAHGTHPGGSGPNLELISFSDDLPYTGGAGAGIYETYQNLTNPLVNEVGLFQFFYTVWPDKFFQLIFFTNFVQTMGGFANERNLSNNATGIGLPIFDQGAIYGSSGVLESRCNMNRLAVWNPDPTFRFFSNGNNFLTIMGQEAGHRWGAFVTFQDSLGSNSNLILGRSNAHWSYYVDVDHSSLEGGNWELIAPTVYFCPTKVDHFGQIDEYTFGLRTPEEVATTFYIGSPSNDQPGARSVGTPVQNAGAS
ncbi:MAG: hypothetical protein O7D32_02590 [bacterium]|nr:hypothetical protein [bacterium]